MKDLALHLLDILENSAKGGAQRVWIDFLRQGDSFEFWISDDGPGLPPEVRDNPTDPFATTRTERKVGLGLALLRMAAEATGGSLVVESRPGRGVVVHAVFNLAHIDAQPVGNLEQVLALACAAWPGLDLQVRIGLEKTVILDTGAIKKELGDLDFGHPQVQDYFQTCLREGLAPLFSVGSALIIKNSDLRARSDAGT